MSDVYRFINDLDADAMERIAARLEFRASDAGYTAFREAYFDKLPLASARRVLAVGCGTGVEVRALKRRLEFQGDIVGVDQSAVLAEKARRLTAEEGLADGVTYQVGDAQHLDLPDERFDVMLAHTLVSHVTDPAEVLEEARRVARPGGMLTIFDGDYASLTFSHSDSDRAKRAEDALLETLINSPRVMRDMPRLLREAGLERTGATAHAYADIGGGNFFASFPEAYAAILKQSGFLPAEDVERWRVGLARDVAEGTFFGASNSSTYLARRTVAATAS